jgi:hypothetical protein
MLQVVLFKTTADFGLHKKKWRTMTSNGEQRED